ncbi:unnamed protein product [Euphydryas editha]|uniref:Uncharacterized protein n=1 Tax=Euphydryas editha TaxID=104508 RepID=A0AAU9TX32_EUPED|nr:unnamed protein product [Euphydryas editha]
MTSYLLLLLFTMQIYKASNLPSNLKKSKDMNIKTLTINDVESNTITVPKMRMKRSPVPLSLQYQHQYSMPNLHVIPLSNIQHTTHDGNVTHSFYQILFPIQHLVPLHDLTVIPLRRVSEQKISYRFNDEEDNRYRNPYGGYGVGWKFGGHGAGHGFHYLYG